jgi:2-hydroxy-3-keto-5-methylthiopentenyl-1-phosphate phosphatase
LPGHESPAPESAWAIFVDFDGTITDRDTFDVLVPMFATPAHWDAAERGLNDASMSLRDVLASQAALVRGSHAEIAAVLRREVAVDPTFAPFARACATARIALTIVSSGVESIVRDRLDEVGLPDLPVVANRVDPRPDGWIMHFRDPVDNGTDKAARVESARRAGIRTIFIGDGRSDYAAATIADVRFAKRGLALETYLTERAVAFESFASFAEIAERLTALGIW